MKTTKFIIGALAIALLGLQSCGKKADKIADAVEKVSEKTEEKEVKEEVVELLNNVEELQKAEDALRNLPQFKGKELRVFQHVHFYGGEYPRITIEILNPDNQKDVDHYEYKNGQWSEPQPVQISGNGDMTANTTPLKDIKFVTVATVFKNWNEKAKTVEGADKDPLDYIFFDLWVPTQKREWDASTIEGTREKYNITFNLDGSVKEFKKQ